MCFSFLPTLSKEKDVALDPSRPYTSGHMGSDSGGMDREFSGDSEDRGEMGEEIPWVKRYEKLWVEVEKREVKSTFKNVAGELKEKFGELFKSRQTTEDIIKEQAAAESNSAEEESSDDDDEGEVIARPTARARSTVLLPISEQRESGLEDSVVESNDSSLCEERMLPGAGSVCQEPDSDAALKERRSPSPELPIVKTDFPEGPTLPLSDIGQSSVLKEDTKQEAAHKEQLDSVQKTPSLLEETETNGDTSKEDAVGLSVLEESSRHSASITGVSDEEPEEDSKRFKLKVGMLMAVLVDLEKSPNCRRR